MSETVFTTEEDALTNAGQRGPWFFTTWCCKRRLWLTVNDPHHLPSACPYCGRDIYGRNE